MSIDFLEAYQKLPEGWLDQDEAELLWKAVNETTGKIIEVGAYKGRSTCLLSQSGRKVYAIDNWLDYEGEKGADILATFKRNVGAVGKFNVLVLMGKVEDQEPFDAGLVYLDGDHSYEGTVAQAQFALKCNPQIIAAHDVTAAQPDVERALTDWLGPWTERAGKLAIWKLNS